MSIKKIADDAMDHFAGGARIPNISAADWAEVTAFLAAAEMRQEPAPFETTEADKVNEKREAAEPTAPRDFVMNPAPAELKLDPAGFLGADTAKAGA